MSTIVVPPVDEEPWPTLGPLVCQFIEDNLCHGPGDLLGQPVRLSMEQKGWIYRMYEVERPFVLTGRPGFQIRTANPRAGQRRFRRCALSLRKGSCKTEFAAWIAIAELHPDGPVRCAGFENEKSSDPKPIARPVTDPYIPMISYTEEQTEELAYGALRRILQEMPIGSDFDIGNSRVVRLDGHGKAEAVATSPNARDGARTTFQHADETHRLVLEGQKKAWTVMLANLAKRPRAEPWALETTTAPEPGGGSVAEHTMEYARDILLGKTTTNAGLFFFHREASLEHDAETPKGLRAGIIEASGPYIAKWSDIDRIAALFEEPDADRRYLERVWLNRLVSSGGAAFDMHMWKKLAKTYTPSDRVPITLGFDGSRFDDSTGLVGCEISTGHVFRLGLWEVTEEQPEIDVNEVDRAVSDVFERFDVRRMYCDPPKWESWVAAWAGRYGEKKVVEWWTNRRKPMAYAIRAFIASMRSSEISHNGDPRIYEHMGNARRENTNLVDDKKEPLWILRKERSNSPKKIDLALATILAWEARTDAISAGDNQPVAEPSIFVFGG